MLLVAYNKVKGGIEDRKLEAEKNKQIEEDLQKDLEWPSVGLASKLPKLEDRKGKVLVDSTDRIAIEVYKFSNEEFKKYVNQVRDNGFNIDYDLREDRFFAKDKDGYELTVLRYEDDPRETMELRVNKEEKETISEEKNSIVDGEVQANNTPSEEKVEEVVQKDDSKNTKENDKESTEIKTNEEDNTKESNEKKIEKKSDGKIRKSVKEAIDAYETVMNEYCDFIIKYNKENDNLAMLEDYTVMLQKQVDASNKFETIDKEELNTEELKYYLDVQNRVLKRMSEVE